MPLVAAALIGVAGSAYAANKSAKAANRSTDAASAAAAEQNALSRDQFEWQKGQAAEQSKFSREQFDWNKAIYEKDLLPLQKKQVELQTRVAEDAMARAAKQDAMAEEQYSHYKKTFKPLEEKVVSEAMGYDGEENVKRRAGIAAANVNQQASNARAQGARLAGRYGLGSTAFAGPSGSFERAQALGAAGAATGAAFDTMDKAIQLRAGATNLGRNMPNTALSAWSGANSSGGTAGNAASSATSGAVTGANFMNNAYGNRANGLATETNMMNSAYGNRIGNIGSSTGLYMNAMNNQANLWGNAASGFGSLAGGLFQKSGGFGGGFGLGALQAGFSNTALGSSGFGTGLAYGNQDLGAYL